MKTLDQKLSSLRPALLEKFEFHLEDEIIKFKTAGFDESSNVEVEFQGVKAFFFADPQRPGDHKPLPKRSLMASIAYHEGGFGYFSAVPTPSDEPKYSKPNFNVDFGHSSMFIEAEKIVINEKAYPLVQSDVKRYT